MPLIGDRELRFPISFSLSFPFFQSRFYSHEEMLPVPLSQ